ncbi:lipid-transfer protein [Streptomyces sp. NPDC058321]|uniref:thiolase C-terminal domain-containing protein n=1 Tax=Streptomyces sp. NPDC058321 TaxID=3346445 RepID=UPI0036F13C33
MTTAQIVGIGATEFSKESGRSELRLSAEATLAALADCGLPPSSVDGAVTMTYDSTTPGELARSVGFGPLTFFQRVEYGGGGGCATVLLAKLAVEAGLAKTVVCYRGLNERSGQRFGRAANSGRLAGDSDGARIGWQAPFGVAVPAGHTALVARRYMHETGTTSEDFGRLSVLLRKHAATNPAAYFYQRPITLDEHQQSPWIVEPLHLLDCCQETDGAVAVVVTSAERARDLAQPAVRILAGAQGLAVEQDHMANYARADVTDAEESRIVARQLEAQAGMSLRELDFGIFYDHFTPLVLMQMEAYGLFNRGESRHALADGRFELDGTFPINPHGGHLGEGYIHGFNGIAEAVRQIRGTAANQLARADTAVVTSGGAVPTSGMVLARA